MATPRKRKKKPHASAAARRASFPRCRAWRHADHLEIVADSIDEFALLAFITDNLVERHPSLCFASVTFGVERFEGRSYVDLRYRLKDSHEVLDDVEGWVNGARGRGDAGRLLAPRTRESRKLKELSEKLPQLTPANAVMVDLRLDCLDCPGIFRPICTKVAGQGCTFEKIEARTSSPGEREAPVFQLEAEVLCPGDEAAGELINHLRAICLRFPMARASVGRRVVEAGLRDAS